MFSTVKFDLTKIILEYQLLYFKENCQVLKLATLITFFSTVKLFFFSFEIP